MNEELLVSAATEDTAVTWAHCKVHDVSSVFRIDFNFNRFWSTLVVKDIARRPEKHQTIVTARDEPQPTVRKLNGVHCFTTVADEITTAQRLR